MTLWARLSEKVSDNGPEVAGSLVGHHGVEKLSPPVAALHVFCGFLVFKFEGPIESWMSYHRSKFMYSVFDQNSGRLRGKFGLNVGIRPDLLSLLG